MREKKSSVVYRCSMMSVSQLLGLQDCLPAVYDLKLLKANVLQYGVRVPLLVNRNFLVLSGAEILLAACAAGIPSVPVLLAPTVPYTLRDKIMDQHFEQLINTEWDAIGASLDGYVIF